MNNFVKIGVFFGFLFQHTFAQQVISAAPTDEGLVKWYSFEEAQELNKKQAKPFIIDVYTDWCGWCKKMMKTTYADPGIASYINTYFYPIKFDAETKDTIIYNGTKYTNTGKEKKSPHQLAAKLLNNQLTYPSTVFVNNNFQYNLLSQGYLEVKKIEPLLVYTVENVFRTTQFEEFRMSFEKAFYDTLSPKTLLKTYSMNEALELNKKKPKKILVNVFTDFCNACKVMNRVTFKDESVIKFINENFYLVEFNAEKNDETITFKGKEYKKEVSANFPFHPLSLELTRKNFILPSLCFLNSELEIIDVLPFFTHENTLKPVMEFYAKDHFKKMKWEDFLKSYKEKNTVQAK